MEDKMKKSYEKINISDQARERIEMAIIMNDEKPAWNRAVGRHSLKVAVAACISFTLLVPTGAYAASKIYQYFQSNVTENNRRLDMEISKVATATPTATVEAVKPTGVSTPEKFISITTDYGTDYTRDKVSGGFQGYDHKNGFEAGKSFWYELIYMDGDQNTILSTYNNDEYEQIQINGRKAVYCKSGNVSGTQYSVDHLTEYSQAMYIFVEEYGYMIRMAAQLNLPKEELIKLAEKITITEAASKKEATAYVLYSEAGKCGWEVENDNEWKRAINQTNFYTNGTLKDDDMTLKVTDVQLLDSVASLDKNSSKKWLDSATYNKLFDKDGKIKSYQREKLVNGDGVTSPEKKVQETETVQPKLVYVTAEVEKKDVKDNEYFLPSLSLFTKEGDMIYEYDNEYAYNRPSYITDAFMDNYPCYFEESLGGQSFYFTKLKNGKAMIHFAYLIDEDQVDGMALCLFDGSGVKIDKDGSISLENRNLYLDISQK